MSMSIRPGQVVLTAALPMPLDGLSLLQAAVEALYGTGESMLDMRGPDVIRVIAPAGGFGPRKQNAPQPFVDVTDSSKIRELSTIYDTVTLTLEDSVETVAVLAQAMSIWFESVGAVNYITTSFVDPSQADAEFHLTVQKSGNPTAHDLRGVAEDKVSELEYRVRELETRLRELGEDL